MRSFKSRDEYIKKYALVKSDFKGEFVPLKEEHFPQMYEFFMSWMKKNILV